jgi:HSP20 family protein
LWSWPSLFDEEDWPMTTSSHLDVYEEGDDVVVQAAVPGVDPDKIDVSFEDGRLWIKAEATRDEEKKHYYLKGRVAYNYNVTVPNVDPDGEPYEALTEDGILKVKFRKAKEKEAKKVKVKVQKKA